MASAPDISVVVPVFDEAGAAPALAREIATAFAGRNIEILFVDDASRDETRAALTALTAEIPSLRLLAHARNAGQSRAIRTGVLAARAPVIVTLDGDGQKRSCRRAGARRCADGRSGVPRPGGRRAGQAPGQPRQEAGLARRQRRAQAAAA